MRVSRKPIDRHLYSELLHQQRGGGRINVFRGNIQSRKQLRGGFNPASMMGSVFKMIKPGTMLKMIKHPTYRKLGLNIAKSAVKQIPKLIKRKTNPKKAMKSILNENKSALLNIAKDAVSKHLMKGGTIGGRKVKFIKTK